MPQCEANKQNGQRCRAKALSASRFCISHDGGAADLKRAAVAKGGRNRRRPQRAPKPKTQVQVRSLQDLSSLLFSTLERVCKGELDAGIGRAVGYLALTCARVAEVVELESRVDALEVNQANVAERIEEYRRTWA